MAEGAAIWEPCDSESEILRWVKNRALVARQGVGGREQFICCEWGDRGPGRRRDRVRGWSMCIFPSEATAEGPIWPKKVVGARFPV